MLHGAGVTGDALLLAGTALLGSFTTFSTWMVQSERLAAEGDGALALANVARQPRASASPPSCSAGPLGAALF